MPQKNRGRRTLFHSFRDAFRGVWLCLRSERNMRIHALACGYVLFFALQIGVSQGELAVLLLAMGMVTAAAAFAALAGVAILARPAFWQVLADLSAVPWKLIVLAISLVAGGLLVFAVPIKRGK